MITKRCVSTDVEDSKESMERSIDHPSSVRSGRALFATNLYYPNVGGVENSIRAMAKVLSSRKVGVDIICSDLDQSSKDRLPSFEQDEHARIYRYRRTKSFFAFALDVIYARSVMRKLLHEREAYELIIARSQRAVISLRLAGFREVTYVVPAISAYQDAHRTTWKRPKHRVGVLINSIIQRAAFSLANRIIVLSENMRSQVAQFIGAHAQVQVVKPGVDQDRFKPVSSAGRIAARKSLSLPEERTILLGLGRFSPVKGFDHAIRALADVPDHIMLVLVGEGPCLELYKSETRRLNLEKRVLFRPRTETPEVYYQAADVFVFTSTQEAFGQVLLEATSSGLPVAAFERSRSVVTAIEEVYGDFNALVSWAMIDDPSTLSAAFLEAADRRLSCGEFQAQRNEFTRRYSWERMVDLLYASAPRGPEGSVTN